ncbi:MAG: sigma-70 family RNA polymerase sigma factor [Turneriella sp.]|nr:sigma-70 family RNA polymerase sigma factor [Leptospiraceae bacterium]MCX7632542.1 sigma-70 family RNA polymerase sigma factor [Turneriella sp.]
MDFAQIVAETKRPVLAAIRRHLNPRYASTIDDVVQEVYLRAYRALVFGKLRDRSKLNSYLYTISRNEALRMNRRCAQEEKKAEKILDRQKHHRHHDNNLDFLRGELESALKQLPEHYAMVVRLSLAGLAPREIVKKLRLRPGTVKSRLSRGLAQLRRLLA